MILNEREKVDIDGYNGHFDVNDERKSGVFQIGIRHHGPKFWGVRILRHSRIDASGVVYPSMRAMTAELSACNNVDVDL